MRMLKCTNGTASLFANTAQPNDDKIAQMSLSIRGKLQMELKDQRDTNVLSMRALPMMPKVYAIPVMQNHDLGKQNQPIVGNEAHIKSTNNGYSRNSMGGFFAH